MNINTSEAAGVRYLHFGSDWVQGAMRIARPYALELDYTKEMMLPLLLRPDDWPRRVLLIGLGAASLTKFLWRYRPDAKLTVVEIDPQVEAVARQFFKLPDDPQRIQMHHADGADFIIQTKQKYDLILVDGFDSKARAGRLDSLPFYLDCKAHLASDGMLCVNLLARRKKFTHSIDRLKEAFDGQLIAFPSRDNGNAIAIGLNTAVSPARPAGVDPSLESPLGMPTSTDLLGAANQLKKMTHLSLLPALAGIAQSHLMAGGVLQLGSAV